MEILTVQQLAEREHISPQTAYRHVAHGIYDSFRLWGDLKPGVRVVVQNGGNGADLDDWISTHDLAELFQASRRTIQRLVEKGAFEYRTTTRGFEIRTTSALAFARQDSQKQAFARQDSQNLPGVLQRE